jgi:hypothetical protein
MDSLWKQAEEAKQRFVRRAARANRDEIWGKPSDWRVSVVGVAEGYIAYIYDPSTDVVDPFWLGDYAQANGAAPEKALAALIAKLDAHTGRF